MRIGEVNESNYSEFVRLFSGNKNIKWPISNTKTQTNTTSGIKPKSETVNQFGLKGMDLHDRNDDWKKIVNVSDDIREKMINLARSEFVSNYGLTDGEARSALLGKYLATVSEKDRLSVAWTLDQVFTDESQRLTAFVKENVPGWQVGKPFDRNILADFISNGSIDKRV